MRRREMDIGQRGVDVIVPHQRLQHRQIDPRLGQRGAERVPQRMRIAGRHPGPHAVIAEHRPQPCAVNGPPRVGPLATRNSVWLSLSGRSLSR